MGLFILHHIYRLFVSLKLLALYHVFEPWVSIEMLAFYHVFGPLVIMRSSFNIVNFLACTSSSSRNGLSIINLLAYASFQV